MTVSAPTAAGHLTPAERVAPVAHTSGEHCAMCSAAHAWVGLDRIDYAGTRERLVAWHTGWGTLHARAAGVDA
ncbi:hypothetical protein [Tsukamurella ocularis]|uniref:hypothetical protein n=1 Tax=Tsukamurella ocularis TaxID=1970234 RepID=UPI0035B5C8AF|nr:tRNA(Arg) A34 adenosine deaminase TadA [Tsukamurella ocularis]MCS3787536.1 tRNA(Arg) A34 adenosine deaminase TadA [Tsukamurella ocularis]MCS3851527.1 tRNA(Arg) A34 adenosine deaminase TadA [Tsukamurella ocularis]